MHPRVELKARELLNNGVALSKYDLAKAAPCNPRTAARMLHKLYQAAMGVRIIGWQKVYYQRVPIYHMSEGSDYPKPSAMDNAERQRRLRRRKKSDET